MQENKYPPPTLYKEKAIWKQKNKQKSCIYREAELQQQEHSLSA